MMQDQHGPLRQDDKPFRENVERAMREWYRIVGEHEDSLPDDELIADPPQKKLEEFLDWCEQQVDGAALVDEVITCLKVGHDVEIAQKMDACSASRRKAAMPSPGQ